MTPTFRTSVVHMAQALGLPFAGQAQHQVDCISALSQAHEQSVSFVSSPKFRALAQQTQAGVLIIPKSWYEAWQLEVPAVLFSDDPYGDFARLTQWWKQQSTPQTLASIHPTAWVHPDAHLGEGVDLGPFVVVEQGVILESGVRIGAHSVIERNAHIGADARLSSHVTVGHHCMVGQRCILHAGVVIGADGFGFAPVAGGGWSKIEQLGAVRIGSDCEIGANTCIDRGALGDTLLGQGVKLDNLVQIGHNVQVGDHVAMAGCVGVAGSAVIGHRCTVGGGAVVLGHLTLTDDVHISAASVVMKSIKQPGQYSGVFPLDENAQWEKNAATLRQLHHLRERLRSLERKSL